MRHFASDVAYHTSSLVARSSKRLEVSWLEKNTGTLDVGWLRQLGGSSIPILQSMFAGQLAARDSAAGTGKSTVGRAFLGDVANLLGELSSTRPYFVRCVKPNSERAPRRFDAALVLGQLRCSGLMGAVQLLQAAYPTRIPFTSLKEQCEAATGQRVLCHPAAYCELLLNILMGYEPRVMYAIGRSKLFLRAGEGAFLQN